MYIRFLSGFINSVGVVHFHAVSMLVKVDVVVLFQFDAKRKFRSNDAVAGFLYQAVGTLSLCILGGMGVGHPVPTPCGTPHLVLEPMCHLFIAT